MYFFFDKDHLSFSLHRENFIFSRKRNVFFPDGTRKIIFQEDFFGKDHLFRTFEENIIFPCIFLRKNVYFTHRE